MNERNRAPAIAVAAFWLGLAALPSGCAPAAPERAPLAGARIGAPFALIDQDGHRRTDKDFAGQYRIVYFGYTFCPDVCPVDVQTIGTALRAFEQADPARARRVTPIFVTVDPARDTPAVLKAFVTAFHPRMVGLTGDPAEIARLAKAYGVYFKAEPPNAEGGYMVAHGRLAFLMGPDDTPIALLPQDKSPGEVEAQLARWVT